MVSNLRSTHIDNTPEMTPAPTNGQIGYIAHAVYGVPNPYITPAIWGAPYASEHQSRGVNQQGPTSGQIGKMTRAVWWVPSASQWGWGGISSGPQVGGLAT